MPACYLGLDGHKVRTQYCLMDPAGRILVEWRVLQPSATPASTSLGRLGWAS